MRVLAANNSSNNPNPSKNIEIGQMVLTSMCRDFVQTLNSTNSSSADYKLPPNLICIQQKLISEVLKMFTLCICDAEMLVEAFLNFQKCSEETIPIEAKRQFKNILLNQLTLHGNFRKFFSNEQMIVNHMLTFYQMCFEITDKLLDENLLTNALCTDKDYNFCFQLLASVSANPDILNSSLFDKIVEKTVEFLYHPSLENANFQFLEKTIIQGIFSDDLWISVTCFHVVCEFLLRLNVSAAVQTYFHFFRNVWIEILNKNPIEQSSLTKTFVYNIIVVIVEVHSISIEPLKGPHCMNVFSDARRYSQYTFTTALEDILDMPESIKYDMLLYNLMLMGMRGKDSLDFSDNASQKFTQLLEMVKECDWMLHSHLIANVMGVMIATVDPVKKMTFMVKMNSALGKEKPLHLKLKLVDLIFAYIPLAAHKIGLQGILKRELTALMAADEDSLALRIALENKFDEFRSDPIVQSLKASTIYGHKSVAAPIAPLIYDRLISSKHFKSSNRCCQDEQTRPNQLSKPQLSSMPVFKPQLTLRMVLEYSEMLRNKTLQQHEKQVVQEIIRNLESSAR